MSQEDSRLHFSTDRQSVLIPCGCGDDDDRLAIGVLDENPPDQTIFMQASFAARNDFRGRLAEAWRAFVGRPHCDSMIFSKQTVSELRDWLTERLDAFEKG